jgi:hypothetical protein
MQAYPDLAYRVPMDIWTMKPERLAAAWHFTVNLTSDTRDASIQTVKKALETKDWIVDKMDYQGFNIVVMDPPKVLVIPPRGDYTIFIINNHRFCKCLPLTHIDALTCWLQDWDRVVIDSVMDAVAPLLDSTFTFVLISDNPSVLESFDHVKHALGPLELSQVSYVNGSDLKPFYVGVFPPHIPRHLSKPRLLAPQLQALEPVLRGRINSPDVDAYMPSYIADGEEKAVPGMQRPVELMRHVIRLVS